MRLPCAQRLCSGQLGARPEGVALPASRRRNCETDVRAVLASPEQVLEVRPNRVVLQSRVNLGSTAQLIRVFVDVDRVPEEVVTVYVTSRVAKILGGVNEHESDV